jgi:hypothetical protein
LYCCTALVLCVPVESTEGLAAACMSSRCTIVSRASAVHTKHCYRARIAYTCRMCNDNGTASCTVQPPYNIPRCCKWGLHAARFVAVHALVTRPWQYIKMVLC